MDDFDKRVIDHKQNVNRRLKERYHFVRAFGYGSVESSLMMNWSKDNIRRKARRDGRIHPSEEDYDHGCTAKDVGDLGGKND